MTSLLREDFIELGISVPSESLTGWATGQLAATKGKEARLQARGVSDAHLSAIRDLIAIVEKRRGEAETSQEQPPAAVLAQRTRDEAMAYWREAKQIARAEFGTQPDVLARFRTGVQTGLLLSNLIKELESTVALLREHSARLVALGGSEAFVARGETLLVRLREVKAGQDAAVLALPAARSQQYHDQGLLYDQVRKLVRIGRLEYILDPEQAAGFSFGAMRRDRGVSTRPRLKKEKDGDR